MSTIRPPIFPTNQPATPAQTPARSAAQRAFFEAAMGRPAAAAQPRPQIQPQAAAPAPVQRMPASLPADPPERILRPGSILDIRV
ncbi:MAG: hypothetical protein V4514_08720 [Pseudomonadota bacterium]|uniref:hypothetical protein n=1 Tax=unclassified Phenylobacterium TaxID=2640670 RepID=UPI0012E35ADE|nr:MULTISPECIES: hypothetical protein [unclassified Phenylobacterium]MBT9471036.1 hypothetical protein [Phenylobacterium sp.]